MKTCQRCRYFVGEDEVRGLCHCEPPRKSSEKGGSYRPSVSPTDPACQHFRTTMPAATNIKGDSFAMAFTRLEQTMPKQEAAKPSHGPKRFCYARQSATLRGLMRECGMPHDDIEIIHYAAQLTGRSGGIFFAVNGHSAAIPNDVFDAAYRAGMIAVTISDAWLRAKLDKVSC